MDVDLAVEIGLEPQRRGPGTYIRKRRLRGLAHDFADLAGGGHIPLAGHDHRFHIEQHAAHARIGQTVDHADLGGLFVLVHAVLLHAEIGFQILRRNGHALVEVVLFHQLDRGFAAQCADFAFKAADPGLARVGTDDLGERLLGQGDVPGLEAMLLDLARQEEVTGDVLFLYFEIAGKLNDFHTVLKRSGDIVQRVRRGDEEHLRQVVVDVEIVVVEGLVLLGVEYLQQGGRGIAPVIGAHLVDFIKAEQRVAGLGAFEGHDDLAGHGSHVGAPVASDFGFVAHPAEGQAHVFAPRGRGDGAGQRGLAHAGRPYEAEDGAFERVGELLDGEELKDALLGLLKAEMVGVEDGAGLGNVDAGFPHVIPRQFQNPVHIVADDGVFGGGRGHHAQLLELGHALFPGFLRHVLGLEHLLKLRDLGLRIVFSAHFFVDGLDLLGKIVFPLVFIHLVFDAALDAPFHRDPFHLGIQELVNLFKALSWIGQLQRFLFFGVFDFEQGQDGVGELSGIAQGGDGGKDLRSEFFVGMGVFREDFLCGPYQRFGFRAVIAHDGQRRDHDLGEGIRPERVFLIFGRQRPPADAVQALEEHLDRAFRQPHVLEHAPDHANGIEIRRIGLFQFGFALRHEADALAVVVHGAFDGLDRGFAAHEEGHDRVRRHDHLP